MEDFCRRPNVQLKDITKFLPELEKYLENYPEICETVEIIAKYSGYLSRQEEMVQKTANQEKITLPKDLDYTNMPGLSREIQEKLNKVKPLNLGQAARTSGITPAALSCIEIALKKKQMEAEKLN